MGKAKDKKLSVQVFSPTEVVFTGSARAVTSFNDQGKFDILPYHANFVSIIKDYVVIYKNKGDEDREDIDIKTGVLHCRDDVVKVFLNIANMAKEE